MSRSRTVQTNQTLTIALVVVVSVLLVMTVLYFGGLGQYPPGAPTKNPLSGTYTVYVVVLGHRDATPLHWNLHANVAVDSITLTSIQPTSLPTGTSWADNGKIVNVVVTITSTNPSFTPVSISFFQSVDFGAQWGRGFTLSLPSGSYSYAAIGSDKDGFQSSASGGLTLP